MSILNPSFINRLKQGYLQQKLYNDLPEEDVVSRQRFILFRLFSLTGAAVSLGVFIKMYLTLASIHITTLAIFALSLVMFTNFYAVNEVRKLRRAYIILLVTACFLLHIVAYTSGGIRTAGTFYFAVIILYAYMLLGHKVGLYFTIGIVVNVTYLYFISAYTDITSFDMFENRVDLISLDFYSNALFIFLLIAAHANYLQSGRNVVISRLTKQKEELLVNNHLLQHVNARLEKKNAELDKFASVASHDLKAPLRAIGNMVGIIEEESGAILKDGLKDHFDVIRNRVLRMENLLNALLSYTHANCSNMDLQPVQVRYLITDIVASYRKQENISLVIGEEMPQLFTTKLIIRVFTCLIDNAIRFNHKGEKRISVHCKELGNHWLFSIEDNGPGIDKKYHEKIFEIFQTLNARDSHESDGAGLAITKKIVEDQSGKVWLESTIGKGTVFYFTWSKNKDVQELMQYEVNELYG